MRSQTDKYAANIMRDISKYMLEEKNIYIPADKFGVWIVPPLIVTKDEIDFIIDAVDDALQISDAAMV